MADPDRVHWSIDGHPVHPADDWEAVITANAGYDTFTATVERKEILRAHQGSHISGHLEDGDEIWYGTLDATPAESRIDTVNLTATGPVARARRMRANWLEQSRDYSLWQEISGDPYNINVVDGNTVADSIQVSTSDGAILFRVTNGTDIKLNDVNAAAAWFMGENATRAAFTVTAKTGGPHGSYALRVYSGSGPSGSLTQRGSDITISASTTADITIAASDDLVAVLLIRTAANATTTENYWVRITNLRLNGRTPTDSLDDMAPGSILADMGATLGWDVSRVGSSGINGLPFYWTGGSWADAFDQLANLDDWWWAAEHNALLYGPWEPVWSLRFSKENEDLDFLPIYNTARVFYTTMADAPRSVTANADPDPLARWDVNNEYEYDLGQSYPSDDIPSAVAHALVEEVSRQRVTGTITIARADTRTARHASRTGWTRLSGHSRYKVRPGQMTSLVPYPGLSPQRIQQVRMHVSDVQVSLGEDVEQVSAAKVLARSGLSHSRFRPRRKH